MIDKNKYKDKKPVEKNQTSKQEDRKKYKYLTNVKNSSLLLIISYFQFLHILLLARLQKLAIPRHRKVLEKLTLLCYGCDGNCTNNLSLKCG